MSANLRPNSDTEFTWKYEFSVSAVTSDPASPSFLAHEVPSNSLFEVAHTSHLSSFFLVIQSESWWLFSNMFGKQQRNVLLFCFLAMTVLTEEKERSKGPQFVGKIGERILL